MKVLYSYNKEGFEANYWAKEIAAASTDRCSFIPFNHGVYLDPSRYIRAQLLDNLYFMRETALMSMYRDVTALIRREAVAAIIVDNCFPYHPEFLRTLPVYKVLRTTDGPLTAYDRDFAYVHAYNHIFYHSPAYSRDLGMAEKLRYVGAKKATFMPLGSFDALCDPDKTEEDILSHDRDIDVVFVGALHVNKMPLLAAIKKAFGRRMKFHGIASIKKNAYFNLKYGFPGWVTSLPFSSYVSLYQRAKIGINVHNRGDYTVGGYRLFDLPANGAMQISDGGGFLSEFFSVGQEVESYRDADELVEKIKYYLVHDREREQIARNGFSRVQRDYKIAKLLQDSGDLIRTALDVAG